MSQARFGWWGRVLGITTVAMIGVACGQDGQGLETVSANPQIDQVESGLDVACYLQCIAERPGDVRGCFAECSSEPPPPSGTCNATVTVNGVIYKADCADGICTCSIDGIVLPETCELAGNTCRSSTNPLVVACCTF